MKAIWKYEISHYRVLGIPKDARVLFIREQHDSICLWVEVCPELPKEERRFFVYGTDHPFEGENIEYLGSAILSGGSLVFHVYEDVKFKVEK